MMASQDTVQEELCPKIDDCWKVKIVLDKAYDAEGLYGMVIKEVCKRCKEVKTE
jgi:hypothetical protein